jgi:polyketide cyclase/dehydrase/lipid transport protein
MPTISLSSAHTRSISIAAPPTQVLDFLADPYNLPRWAPGFARSVKEQDGQLLVDTGEGERPILMSVSPEQGTVDLVSAAEPRVGAFSRLLPNGDGCEYLFTLFFAPDVDETAVEAQMAVVDDELETVRALCEPTT